MRETPDIPADRLRWNATGSWWDVIVGDEVVDTIDEFPLAARRLTELIEAVDTADSEVDDDEVRARHRRTFGSLSVF